MNYENPSELSQLFDLVKLMLKERGEAEICDLLNNASIEIANSIDSTWFGGTIDYIIQIKVPVRKYSSYNKLKIEIFEGNISSCLTEITKVDTSSKFSVKIIPSLTTNITAPIVEVVPQEHKELRQNIDIIRSILVSVATGGDRIPVVNDRYQTIHTTVKLMCGKMDIPYNNTFDSLWDWYGKWRADFPSYQERRHYISELFAPTLTSLDNYKKSNVEVLVQLDDWSRIKRTIHKIKNDSLTAKNEEDFQTIGLLCREILISLGKIVYDPARDGEFDDNGTKIGNADAERMISAYIKTKLGGKHNKELRDYAKASKDIANQLTHKSTATRRDMLLAMSSTISLVNFIGILEDKM